MKSATASTFLMGLLAAAASAGAAYFYPWPEANVTSTGKVGTPLFESYETNQVRGIEIMRYNPDKGELERLNLPAKKGQLGRARQREFCRLRRSPDQLGRQFIG